MAPLKKIRLFLLVFLLTLGSMQALLAMANGNGNGDVVEQALGLYEKHLYEEAARLLQPKLVTIDANKQASAKLALGMIYLGNGILYRDLQETAVVIELDYLTKLSKQGSGGRSRYVNYYLGIALLAAGKPVEASSYLRKFSLAAPKEMKPFAEIALGLAYYKQNEVNKAEKIWAQVVSQGMEIKAALAAAYAQSNDGKIKSVDMADAVLREAKLQGYTPSSRMRNNLLRAYSQAGASEKALVLLGENEFKEASYVENIGDSKSIGFYDINLLGDISSTYLHMSQIYLEQAALDPKLADIASYYLADTYFQLGNAELSLSSSAKFLVQSKLPVKYRHRAMVHQANALNQVGKKIEARRSWTSVADLAGDDLGLLGMVVQSCASASVDCSAFEKLTLATIEQGEGKKIFPLNAALGQYYFIKKKYDKAELFIEAGRDKAHKNKIEVNDPLLLVSLAEAYYRNKKFSENLEIYFELGKHYPAVRQIQEAMQGIYSMEQQSAGDVKIF
jgi:tetratricopeptide (TPR) repeat protein